jgi:hypothetical protein
MFGMFGSPMVKAEENTGGLGREVIIDRTGEVISVLTHIEPQQKWSKKPGRACIHKLMSIEFRH